MEVEEAVMAIRETGCQNCPDDVNIRCLKDQDLTPEQRARVVQEFTAVARRNRCWPGKGPNYANSVLQNKIKQFCPATPRNPAYHQGASVSQMAFFASPNRAAAVNVQSVGSSLSLTPPPPDFREFSCFNFIQRWELERACKPIGSLLTSPSVAALAAMGITPQTPPCQIMPLLAQAHPQIPFTFLTPEIAACSLYGGTSRDPHSEKHRVVEYSVSVKCSGTNGHQCVSVLLHPPRMAPSCRMYRKYGAHRFLRANFILQNCSHPQLDQILATGITVAGCTFRFLCRADENKGEDEDQGAGKACIMFAVYGPGLTAHSVESVIDWHFPVAFNLESKFAKFNARMALAFSSSAPTVQIEPNDVSLIEDLWADSSRSTEACLTDGCAPVGRGVMKAIKQALGLPIFPSVIQMRLGSAKGTLYVDPHTPDSQTLCLRTTSMVKYRMGVHYATSRDRHQATLDVCRVFGDTGPGHLNRQFIAVLEAGGVPGSTFVELQREAVSMSAAILFSDDPKVTLRWLFRRTSTLHSKQGEEQTAITTDLLALMAQGFTMAEPYVHKLLCDQLERVKTKIREKAKIEVPLSRQVVIIADPLDVLEPNQAFLQVTGRTLDDEPIGCLVGHVLVARNPCVLPSDVQKMQCVDHPRLRMYEDVLILSVKDFKSAASRLSGGDYDGDTVWVCWDPRLVEPFDGPREPPSMSAAERQDYEGQFITDGRRLGDVMACTQAAMDDPVQKRDALSRLSAEMRSVWVRHEGGQLNLVSHMWKCAAEMWGLHDQDTLRLARLSAELVDAPKTGKTMQRLHFEALKAHLQQRSLQTPNWHVPKRKRAEGLGAADKRFVSNKAQGQMLRDLERPQPNERPPAPGPLPNGAPRLDGGLQSLINKMQSANPAQWQQDRGTMVAMRDAYNRDMAGVLERPRSIDLTPDGVTTKHTLLFRKHVADNSRPEGYWGALAYLVTQERDPWQKYCWTVARKDICRIKAESMGDTFCIPTHIFAHLRIKG